MRQRLWRQQILKLALFREVAEAIRRSPAQSIDRDLATELIVMWLPTEDYEGTFDTLVTWGRLGNLFGYDEGTQRLWLQ